MRKIILSLVTLIGLLAAPSTAYAGRDKIVMFSSPGCGACIQFKNTMAEPYKRSRLGKKVRLSIVNSDSRRAMRRYKGRVHPISYTPTFVLMRNGREISRSVGYGGRKSFMRTVKNMHRK